MRIRPRRNRRSSSIRDMLAETRLQAQDFILPMFVHEGEQHRIAIASMPGQFRLSIDLLVEEVRKAYALGVRGVALFPALEDSFKDTMATESCNPDGLLQRCVRAIKAAVPGALVITDVAFDPYSSDGHDGLLRGDEIVNDESLPVLAAMAVAQAAAGADIVAPSDMMDGRVGAIRDALDAHGYQDIGICSYCVKYASAFYGPFRDALDSAPRSGDKKTYQMDPRNVREALREVRLDEDEGADWIMVKPGLPYLDVIRAVREITALPISAYHVSGEYAMLKAAAANGWLDYDRCLLESLTSLRRAGADMIFTYGAIEAATLLRAHGQ